MKYNFNFDLYRKRFKGTFIFNGNIDTVYDTINDYTNSKEVNLYREAQDSNALFKYIKDNLYIDLGISLIQDTEDIETIEITVR